VGGELISINSLREHYYVSGIVIMLFKIASPSKENVEKSEIIVIFKSASP
jgi:hypothetical protein